MTELKFWCVFKTKYFTFRKAISDQ